jgi:hypothetical protein
LGINVPRIQHARKRQQSKVDIIKRQHAFKILSSSIDNAYKRQRSRRFAPYVVRVLYSYGC